MIRRLATALLALCAAGTAFAQADKGDVILGQLVEFHYATADKTDGHDIERTAAGTAQCYPSNSATEQTTGVSDSGLTEFDSIVGMNRFQVDTSQSGFTAGTDYSCWIKQSTLNGVTTSYPVGSFSIENRFPLKGYILLHATEDTGASSTSSVIELTGNVITSDGQYKYNHLWDITDGWTRAITDSNAASDNVTIYPAAPAAPTNGATLYITLDVIYPTNFFDPSTTTVVVGGFGATVGGSTALTNNAGANIESVFNNGGSAVSSNAQIQTIADNVTGVDLLGYGTTLQANIRAAQGMLAYGTCSGGSSTTTCIDAALTQADSYWNNWTMIVVQGQPPRCVRGFTASTDALSWPTPQALPSSAASQKYVLLAAPECRTQP